MRLGRALALAALGALGPGAAGAEEGRWFADPVTGCQVWNARPVPGEVVSWSGRCRDGRADGEGVLAWFADGRLEGRYSGMVYASELDEWPRVGDELLGYVDRVRRDGKIDVSLRKRGRAAELDAEAVILDALEESDDGFLPLHDKSPAEAIARRLDLSKRVFKAAVGGLYRQERIELCPDGIRLRR